MVSDDSSWQAHVDYQDFVLNINVDVYLAIKLSFVDDNIYALKMYLLGMKIYWMSYTE